MKGEGNQIVYNGTTIRKTPWYVWFWLNPKKRNALAYNSQIFVSPLVFNDLTSLKPSAFSIAILKHENYHLVRKRILGNLNYTLKILFSSGFRLREELNADMEMMKYLKPKGETFPIEKRAKRLSSSLYRNMISYNKAKQKLEEIWNSI